MSPRLIKIDLSDALREIGRFDRAACRTAWTKAYKVPPPKYLSVPFMQRVLAHDLQCRTLGGYSAATRHALKAALSAPGGSASIKSAASGATLVREWNGRLYRVEVKPDGYVLDGKAYRSLSAIARHITGAQWSGPRFFGLTPKRSA